MDRHFGSLPPELLITIFSRLRKQDKASCSQVCKSWYTASCVPSLWKKEEARLDLKRLSSDVIRSLQQRRVRRVVVTGGHSGEALRNLLAGLPSMEHLELTLKEPLSSCQLVVGLNVQLPSLKTFDIYYSPGCPLYTVLDMLFRCAFHLENVTFVRTFGPIEDVLCERYGSRLRKLKHLTFQTGRLSDEGIKFLTGALPHTPSTCSLSIMEHLEISNIDHLICRDGEPLTDMALEHIAKAFPSLKSLHCKGAQLNGSGLMYLLHMPQLESLTFTYCEF